MGCRIARPLCESDCQRSGPRRLLARELHPDRPPNRRSKGVERVVPHGARTVPRARAVRRARVHRVRKNNTARAPTPIRVPPRSIESSLTKGNPSRRFYGMREPDGGVVGWAGRPSKQGCRQICGRLSRGRCSPPFWLNGPGTAEASQSLKGGSHGCTECSGGANHRCALRGGAPVEGGRAAATGEARGCSRSTATGQRTQ